MLVEAPTVEARIAELEALLEMAEILCKHEMARNERQDLAIRLIAKRVGIPENEILEVLGSC